MESGNVLSDNASDKELITMANDEISQRRDEACQLETDVSDIN